ncbi:MAG: class I SAM-dependent methyltransferase [Gemmatimonadaceae bacterium]|nr:class I SAM-dependent methyltransferase [Gemmatimonadaceae bacterium]
MKKHPFVDFYESKKIIPVHQDTTDFKKHLQRRNALYHQLSVIPGWVAGRSVIEFGPGTGDNAMHTSSLLPARYVLVDGNSESVKEVKARVADRRIHGDSVEVVHSLADDFETDERFDLVICEGLVPGQLDPSAFLRKIAGLCKPGGVVITTTAGAASGLGDICRHAIMPFFTRQADDFWEQVDLAIDFFDPDLQMLPGMSRYPKDWVLDTVMYDWGERWWFSIADAIAALDSNFAFHGSSPRFFQDMRWYKSIHGLRDYGFNELATQQYHELVPLLLDYRNSPRDCPMVHQISGTQLETLCQQAWTVSRKVHTGKDLADLEEFLGIIRNVAQLVEGALPQTAASLSDFCTGVSALHDGTRNLTNVDMGSFRGLFGRGQQYISLVNV